MRRPSRIPPTGTPARAARARELKPEEAVPMRTWLVLAALVLVAFPSLARSQPTPAMNVNPFFTEWTTPFGVPPFDQIKDQHFMPAIREAIARQRAEVKAIAASKAAPTFANTIEALDATGELTEKVEGVFSNLYSANTNDSLQAIAKEAAPMRAALRDDILLDEALFRRVKTVWERRAKLKLTPEQARLLEETHKSFVRGGANLGAAQKERLREINQRLSVLGVTFAENLLKETNDYRLVIEKREDLAGLPDRVVAGAAEAAKAKGLEGKWVFGLQAPSIWPFLESADNRELRRQILDAYTSRCNHGNERDNKAVLAEIATLRAERAKLLGYPTYADFVLAERMAKTPAAVNDLLGKVWTPALAVARKEAAEYQAKLDEGGGGAKLEPCDWRYCAEKVRQSRYALDEQVLRPYFKLDNVREGAFYVAQRLFGINFIERKDLPVYEPEVRAFEVKDADGSHLGVFYVDYHPRPGKRGGAWSNEFRAQCFKQGQDVRPIVVNVCNFSRPAGDAPALLSLDEVETLFHEFGHSLHALLSRIHYRSLGEVARDFVELPSQIMENWVTEPEVLKVYARHWQTGEVIPDSLIEKIKQARKFNQGFATVEYVAASYLDLDWHTLTDTKPVDPAAFENASLARIGLMPEIVVRYRSPYFAHIFSGGYSAGYYSYLWSEVLDTDAFQAFKEKGLFDQATARSFRTNILEKGGAEDPMALWLRFRGRPPRVEPLLEKRGLD
jgi:peptidyl-dipeptidase Dcp